MLRFWWLLVVVTGCVSSSSLECASGIVCPDGTVCDAKHDLCVLQSQLGCTDEGQPCTFDANAGTCRDGVCLAQACGDGFVTAPEQCEPGQTASCRDFGYYVDGELPCSADCTYDKLSCEGGVCGDQIVQMGHEVCDAPPGTVVAQCNDTAVGFYDPGNVYCNGACQLDTSGCTGFCGDGVVNGSEVCDGQAPQVGCLGYGFGYGTLACSRCGPGFATCGTIGWRTEQLTFSAGIGTLYDQGISPYDHWFAGLGKLAHIVDHQVRNYAVPSGAGRGLWVQGNEVFLSGTPQIQHGVLDASGNITWTAMTLPLATVLTTDLRGVGTNDLYALARNTANSTLAMFHYNGSTWTQIPAPSTSDQGQGFAPIAANDIWLSTNNLGTGTLWHYNGSWSTVTVPTGIQGAQTQLNVVWAPDATHVYVGGDVGFGMWNGSTWKVVSTPGRVVSIHGASANDVVVGGSSFTLRYDGTVWNTLASTGYDFAVADMGSTVYRVVLDPTLGSVIVDYYEGSAWLDDDLYTEINAFPAGFSAVDGTLFIASSNGGYMRSPGGSLDPVIGNATSGVWARTASDAWFISGGGLLHYHDTIVDDLTTAYAAAGGNDPSGSWGAAANDIWFCDNGASAMMHWDGNSFTKTTVPVAPRSIRGSGANDIWVTTLSPTLLHYNGSTWTQVTVPGSLAVQNVYPVSPTLAYAVGNGQIGTWNGTTWTVTGYPGPAVDVWARSASDVFVIDDQGMLEHYDGVSWQPVRVTTLARGVGLVGDGPRLYTFGDNGFSTLHRHTPWN